MKTSEWVKLMEDKYEIEVRSTTGEGDVSSRIWHIKDPHENGLSFTLHENSAEQASIFMTDELFNLSRFNIAEGYTPDVLLAAARSILSGELPLSKKGIARFPLLEFKDSGSRMVAIGTLRKIEIMRPKKFVARLHRAQQGYTRIDKKE